MEVVGLGAFADYETEDEYRAQLCESALSAAEVRDALTTFRRQLSIRIEEFAILADGRRLVFDERGYSERTTAVGGAPDPFDQWAFQTVESVERNVRCTVLPDDDEPAAERDHPWPHIAACLGALGVAVSPEELMQVPYEVVLSERLRARLSA